MTIEEAKKIGEICSMLNAKERQALQKYLAEIVLRDNLQKLQITPQDVIIERLKEIDKEKDTIFNYLQNATPKDDVEEHERELAEQRYLELQGMSLIQFAEYDNIKVKNTLKSNHQTF
jgi:hypothetical protein